MMYFHNVGDKKSTDARFLASGGRYGGVLDQGWFRRGGPRLLKQAPDAVAVVNGGALSTV